MLFYMRIKPAYLLACLLIVLISACKHELTQVTEEIYDDGSPRVVRFYDESNGKKVLKNEKTYYKGLKVQTEGAYKDNKRDGLWIYYYDNGNKWSETEFKNGVNEGKSVTYYENGKVRYEGYYKNDVKTGKWKFYDESGKLEKEVDF